jgi:deazaflavin-dependent oxidoreductase (nitroreductase family)
MLLRRLGRRPLSVIGTNLPVGYLTTVGRRTGELRTTPVVPVDSPAGVAVIASNWGQNRRPGWALNLTADPRCLTEREGSVRTCRARSASSAEREEIWQRALALYPAWASYDARVERDLEIFVLECVAGW